MTVSKESPNGLTPVVRSIPRSLASVPLHFLDIIQARSFGNLFLQILPLSTQYTLLSYTNFASILQAPSFNHTLGSLGPKPPAFPSISFVLKRPPLAFPSTPSPRPPTSRVFRRARIFPFMQPLSRTNPSPRTSNFSLCTRLRKSFGFFQRPRCSSG